MANSAKQIPHATSFWANRRILQKARLIALVVHLAFIANQIQLFGGCVLGRKLGGKGP